MNTFCRCLLLAALTTALPQPAPAAETQRVDVARFSRRAR
jgi:hypothetical protein